MHLTDALGTLDNYNSEGFHNVIVNIFDMVLEDSPMLFPHAITKLKTNLSLKSEASVPYQVHTP